MAEYINKESAISIFRAKAEMATCTPAQPYFYKAVKMLELLPAADVAPVVHGRWIDRPGMKGQVYCSKCATIEKSTDSNYKSQRCPNCGARMDKEEAP